MYPESTAEDEAVQAKVAPLTPQLKAMAAELLPEQMVCTAGVAVTKGVGFTNTVAVSGNPGQSLAPDVVAVAMYNTVSGVVPLFTNVCTGMLFVPLAVAPLIPAGIVAVQAKVTPGVAEVRFTLAVESPLQIVCAGMLKFTTGEGYTTMVTVMGVPLHP